MEEQPSRRISADLVRRIELMKLEYDKINEINVTFHNGTRKPLILEFYETNTLDETVEYFGSREAYIRKVLKEADVFIREDIMEEIEPDDAPPNFYV